MHQLEKNIKGITLLEILVVIAIIGVISGFSYPSISDWRSSRVIKDEVQKTASLFQNINAQVQRGQYSYVQVEVDVAAESITLTSKGMQTSNFSSLVNSVLLGSGFSKTNNPGLIRTLSTCLATSKAIFIPLW